MPGTMVCARLQTLRGSERVKSLRKRKRRALGVWGKEGVGALEQRSNATVAKA